MRLFPKNIFIRLQGIEHIMMLNCQTDGSLWTDDKQMRHSSIKVERFYSFKSCGETFNDCFDKNI